MIWNRKPSTAAAAQDGKTVEAAKPNAPLGNVAAAWPNGSSQLAIAAAACQSCTVQAVCGILFGHTLPNPIMHPPAFCPYAAEAAIAGQPKG